MMRKSIAVSASAIAAVGSILASSPAWADSPPPNGTNAGNPIAVTITNPASATVTIGASTLTIDAVTNDSQATAVPAISTVMTNVHPEYGWYAGGVPVSVQDSNLSGYTLDATSSDLQPPSGAPSGTPAAPAYDLNIEAVSSTTGTGPQFTTAHMGASATALNDPSYTTVLSNSQPSTTSPKWAYIAGGGDPGPAGTDTTEIAFWVQPNSLLGTATGYSATVSFLLIPNAS